MFIGIAGPICSGKRTIAEFLIQNHNFTRLRLRPSPCASPSDTFDTSTPVTTPSETLAYGLRHVHLNGEPAERKERQDGKAVSVEQEVDAVWFDSMYEMTEYVTKRWRQNYVTVDIWT